MKNYAGQIVKQELIDELTLAGIYAHDFGFLINDGEVKSPIRGIIGAWGFTRAWYYWVAEGAGIPIEDANGLNEYYSETVRVGGYAGGRKPIEESMGFGIGSYHIDTQEGLKALADLIKSIYRRNGFEIDEQGSVVPIKEPEKAGDECLRA